MTTNNLALYKLLVKFGATPDEAESAASVDTTALVTKADLQVAIGALEASLTRLILTTMISMTAIFGIIGGLFRVFFEVARHLQRVRRTPGRRNRPTLRISP